MKGQICEGAPNAKSIMLTPSSPPGTNEVMSLKDKTISSPNLVIDTLFCYIFCFLARVKLMRGCVKEHERDPCNCTVAGGCDRGIGRGCRRCVCFSRCRTYEGHAQEKPP